MLFNSSKVRFHENIPVQLFFFAAGGAFVLNRWFLMRLPFLRSIRMILFALANPTISSSLVISSMKVNNKKEKQKVYQPCQ